MPIGNQVKHSTWICQVNSCDIGDETIVLKTEVLSVLLNAKVVDTCSSRAQADVIALPENNCQ